MWNYNLYGISILKGIIMWNYNVREAGIILKRIIMWREVEIII